MRTGRRPCDAEEAKWPSDARGMPPAARSIACKFVSPNPTRASSRRPASAAGLRGCKRRLGHVLAVGDRVVVNDVADRRRPASSTAPRGSGLVEGAARRTTRSRGPRGSYRRTQITKLHVPPAAPAPAPAPLKPPRRCGDDGALTAVNGAAQLRVDTTPAGRVPALKVCAVQIRATPGDVEGNLRRAAAAHTSKSRPPPLCVTRALQLRVQRRASSRTSAAFSHGSFDGVFKFFIDLGPGSRRAHLLRLPVPHGETPVGGACRRQPRRWPPMAPRAS